MRSLLLAALSAMTLWATACGGGLVSPDGPDAAGGKAGTGGAPDGGPPTFALCAGCTRTPIGVPTWNPGSVASFAGEDYLSLLQSLLAPRHQFYSYLQEFGPAVAHPPPYTDEVFAPLAARGITPRQAFTDAEFKGLSSVITVITIVPSPNAPVASSFDFPSGPVIPNVQFPITATGGLYRNGQMYFPSEETYWGYQEFSPPVNVSGLNPPVPAQGASHVFLTFAASIGAGSAGGPPIRPDGAYEYRLQLTDSTGAGWLLTAPFVVGNGGAPSTGIKLVPDATGSFDGTNAAGIVGSWWATGDYYGADASPGTGTCPTAGFPQETCSVLVTPTPGAPFTPDPGGRGMCAAGVANQVVLGSDGMPAWSSIWGDIIGLSFNYQGPADAGASGDHAYDAPAHGITGFAFDIDAVPTGGHLRVEFPTIADPNNAAYWLGATSDVSPIPSPGHYEMRWDEIGGPFYLPYPPPFDPTTITGVRFQVVSNTAAPISFSFCISNVMLLTD